MADMTVSGIVSGIDWESMITKVIDNAQKPALVQVNKRTNLTNKKALFEEMQGLTETLQNSITTLRLNSTYQAKTLDAERIDKSGSYKGVLTAKVNAEAEVGVYDIYVKQIAKAQTQRSNQFTGALGSSSMGGLSSSTLWITNGGQRTSIEVKATDTLESLKSRINNTIKTLADPMSVTASVVDNRLIFKSDDTGLGTVTRTETITYKAGSSNALSNMNIDTSQLEDGDLTVKDSDGNEWTLGKDFDIVNGEIRWREYSKLGTASAGSTYTVQYTAAAGDTYTTGEITRGSGNSDADALNFNASLDDTIADRMTITDDEGYEYKYGTDFTVNGKSIIWSKAIGASRPDEGQTYTVSYTCRPAETVSATRQYTSQYTAIKLEDSSGNYILYDDNFDASKLYVTDGTNTYTAANGDFTISAGSGTDPVGLPVLTWGSNHPASDANFTAYYTTDDGGGEVFDIDVTRSSTDATTASYSDFTNGAAKITCTENGVTKTYYQGIDFDLLDTDGKVTVSWREEAAWNAPLPWHSTYNDNAYTLTTTKDTLIISDGTTFADFDAGSSVITTGSGSAVKTWQQGVDFDIVEGSGGEPVVRWRTDAAQNAPSSYTLTLTQADGTTKTFSGSRAEDADATVTGIRRTYRDSLTLSDVGFGTANGQVSGLTYEGSTYAVTTAATNGAAWNAYHLMARANSGGTINLDWFGSGNTRTVNSNLPAEGTELTVTYKSKENTFSLDDGGSGLLAALGLDLKDEEHFTAAQNAIFTVDDDEVEMSSNHLDYENDVINGLSLDLKGEGEVSLDISHDMDKAVEAINTFVESYNTLMDWINTRSSEKQVNTDYSDDDSSYFSRSSDEFHTSWGLLYGNSYLRSTKTSLRSIIGQNYSFSFTERSSSSPVYGTMGYNGLKSNSTLSISIGGRTANITIEPGDTITSIAAKINDTSGTEYTNEAWKLSHDDDGNLQSYVKAEVVNDRLVIKTGSTAGDDEITLSGTSALNALKMNYTYKGLYQIGLETTSDDFGASGELEFDSETFTEAMEDNTEETQQLMIAFAKSMEKQVKTMLQSSGDYSGTLKTEISNIESQISDIDDYLEKFQERLDRQEASLRSRYAAAEERIAELSQQASSISGILSQLNSYSSSSSSS